MGKYQKRDRISRLISWGHWFTFTNILLCLLIGVLYIETMGSTGTILGDVYLVLNWFGHFAFLPFVFFILLLFPLCLILPYSKILRGAGALIASFGIFILLF
ncbi:MAG: alkaline phosphatase, partial [Idiomarina sp.]|nr:alkaline phosphatase [Idiomarina sp.]